MEKICLIVDDMFFAAKINAAAAAAGREVVRLRTQEQLEQLVTAPPQLVIIDLKAERLDPLQAIAFLKSSAALCAVPVVAFTSHVQTETIRRAQAAGCDVVLPHSAFTQMLPEIVAGRLDRLVRRPPLPQD
jgi:DNA-binding NarL/FixJ family response regulator